MNVMPELPRAPKADAFTKLLIFLTGADEETLRACPESDWSAVRAVGLLLLFSWVYLGALFGLLTHRVFAPIGTLRLDLILVSFFISSFVILIDSFMVVRSGWHLAGLQEIRRAGLDITGGLGARIKASVFVICRIGLSVGIALLTGTAMALLMFGPDINAHVQSTFQQANAALIQQASAAVDQGISRSDAALKVANSHYAALSAQAVAARLNQLDPMANDPLVQSAQQELAQLTAQQAKDDESVRQAEQFETSELGGWRANARNSGREGNGSRHKAALAQLAHEQAHTKATARALGVARQRLATLRSRQAAPDDAARHVAASQTTEFERVLAIEKIELNRLQEQHDRLVEGRDDAIRRQIEHAPGYIAPDTGFLTQIRILEEIAGNDPKIKAIVLLVDLTSFGFELAAVLAKVTSYVPTTYSAMLARDTFARAARIADELATELAEHTDDDRADGLFADIPLGRDPGAAAPSPPPAPSPTTSPSADDPLEAPKRRRGRPRKVVH